MSFIDISLLTKLVADKKIIKFAEFINSEAQGASYPDYKTIDLMKIASLVKYIYVVKVVPKGDKRLLIHFSGTSIDELYEKNVTGQYLEDIYTGDNKEAILNNMNALVDEKKSFYYVNTAKFKQPAYEKRRIMKRLACPCSSDGETINYYIGLVIFDLFSHGDTDISIKV